MILQAQPTIRPQEEKLYLAHPLARDGNGVAPSPAASDRLSTNLPTRTAGILVDVNGSVRGRNWAHTRWTTGQVKLFLSSPKLRLDGHEQVRISHAPRIILLYLPVAFWQTQIIRVQPPSTAAVASM